MSELSPTDVNDNNSNSNSNSNGNGNNNKFRPPLEMHSPNRSRIIDQSHDTSIAVSPKCKVGGSSPMMKSPPRHAPRMPSALSDGHDENSNEETTSSSSSSMHWLSPIGRGVMDFDTPSNDSKTTPTRTNDGGDDTTNDGMDSSFPDARDDDIEIRSPGRQGDGDANATAEEEEQNGGGGEDGETGEERMMREIEESEALARQLMAEEAMASYAMSANYLRDNADQFSVEDMAALQAAMADEDPDVHHPAEGGDYDRNHHRYDYDDENEIGEGAIADGAIDDSRDMSYDALLRLGERIGSVKEERWALIAHAKTNELCPELEFAMSMARGKAENHTEVKCQVCQFAYEEGEILRRLPCGHCFHAACIERWLETKDTCALCRKSIVE